MRPFLNKLLSTTTIALLTAASTSWADPITLNYNGFANGGMSGKITKTSPSPAFTDLGAGAGQFNFNVISSSDPAIWGNTLQAFCIDVDHWLVTNMNVEYDIVSATNSPPGGLTDLQHARAGWLYDNHASDLGSSAQFDSAFQLALWEIFFEEGTTLNLSNGTFKSNTFGTVSGITTQSLANSLLAGIGNGAVSSDWEFYVLNPINPSNNQRLITALSAPSIQQISEPGTLFLMIAAGLGFVFFSAHRGSNGGMQTASRT